MNRSEWEAGQQQEVAFWRQWIRSSKNYTPVFLRAYFGPLIGDKDAVSILDAGSGAVNLIGQAWAGTRVRVTCCDLLAEQYRKFFPCYVEQQDMEKLTYEDNTFDIVHCSNALDHCFDPRAAIREMIRVCKPGGWIYLRHFRNVGKLERYEGLHQWNIDYHLASDDAVFWNRAERFWLIEVQDRFRTAEMEDHDPGYEFVVSRYQKPHA